jgi:hypothetical protein
MHEMYSVAHSSHAKRKICCGQTIGGREGGGERELELEKMKTMDGSRGPYLILSHVSD